MPRSIDNLEDAFVEMYEFITDLPSGLDGFESDFDEAFKELENLKVALAQPGDPLTLDQLRVRWKGCDSCKAACWNCSHNLLCCEDNDKECHYCFDQSMWEYNNYRDYCPDCGRPLTEEAWVELERRLKMPEPPKEE